MSFGLVGCVGRAVSMDEMDSSAIFVCGTSVGFESKLVNSSWRCSCEMGGLKFRIEKRSTMRIDAMSALLEWSSHGMQRREHQMHGGQSPLSPKFYPNQQL